MVHLGEQSGKGRRPSGLGVRNALKCPSESMPRMFIMVAFQAWFERSSIDAFDSSVEVIRYGALSRLIILEQSLYSGRQISKCLQLEAFLI